MTVTVDQLAVELTRTCPAALGHLWQATVFGLLVSGLACSLRRAPARLRHGLYLLASMKFLLPSVFLLAFLSHFYDRLPKLIPDWLAAILNPYQILAAMGAWLPTGGPVSAGEVPRGGWIWSVLLMLWLAGVTVLAALWGRRLVAFRGVLARSQRVESGPLWQQLQAVRQRLRLRRPLSLVLSAEMAEPGVWGVWRSTVVLPASMPVELNPEELEVVLLHELVHVRRRDNLVSHLHMALCCLFWFHPLVWWIDRRLLLERERACDDRVVELSGASEVYARSLVKVLRLGLGWRLAGVSGAGGADLRGRLEHIRAGAPRGVSLWHRGVVAAAFCLLCGVSLAAIPFCPQPQQGGVTGTDAARILVTAPQPFEAAEARGDEIGACNLPDSPPEIPPCPHRGGTFTGGGVRAAI